MSYSKAAINSHTNLLLPCTSDWLSEAGLFLNFADGGLRRSFAGLDRAFGNLQAGFFQAVKDEQFGPAWFTRMM